MQTQESSKEYTLVAHYATQGGRYEIKAYEHKIQEKIYYKIEHFTNKSQSGCTVGLSFDDLGTVLARSIFFAKKYDKINYKAIKEWEETTRLLVG